MSTSSQPKKNSISVVLATFNEEKNISRCLQAVHEWVDEIIVVDGSSSDETVKVAKQYGARIITTTNKPIFHINKQMAMDAATGKIILQLDADEVVDSELKIFVLQLRETYDVKKYDTETQPVAWWIRRKNLFLGRFLQKGGQYPDPVIRLYINGFARLPQKDVHEQMQVDGVTGTAEGHLIHYSNPTFSDYLRKWNVYSSLAADELFNAKTQPTFLFLCNYMFYKPAATFISLFVRHKGFVDGIAGFVFALMSGLFHQVTALKLWEKWQVQKP